MPQDIVVALFADVAVACAVAVLESVVTLVCDVVGATVRDDADGTVFIFSVVGKSCCGCCY